MKHVVDWLLAPEQRGLDAAGVFAGGFARIVDGGVPVWRAKTGLRTSHPEVWARNLEWRRGQPLIDDTRPHDLVTTSTYRDSPAARVMGGDDVVRRRLRGAGAALDFAICEELAARGGADYVCFGLAFADVRNFVSFATDDDAGFSDAQLAALREVLPALSLRLELCTRDDAMKGLLEVYLGNDAARRVLGGSVRRGDGTALRAAIVMSDLRNFTVLADGADPRDVVAVLDVVFDAVAGAIVDGGGEVLKFIGDAVLAVFVDDDDRAACARAVAAADEALRRLDAVNAARAAAGAAPVGVGLGVHVGDVFYGNIGSRTRLDFTVIGSAVNETARVESMCRPCGAPLLLSDAFVARLGGGVDVVSVGTHALKGVARPVELFTLPRFAR